MTDAELFKQICSFLYGLRYQRAVSTVIERNERTVRRYANGTTPVPEDVWARLAICMAAHQDRLESLGDALVARFR